MRLPRKFSMKRHAEFALSRKQGEAKAGAYLVLSTVTDPTLPHHKFGIIVTRKIGNAVTRNTLKRRIHAIQAKHIHRITTPEGHHRHIVTILRWRAPQATQRQLERDWLRLARKLGAIETPAT